MEGARVTYYHWHWHVTVKFALICFLRFLEEVFYTLLHAWDKLVVKYMTHFLLGVQNVWLRVRKRT